MKARIPKNSGGAQNMNQMIRQAQKMQDQITELQEDIESREFTATAGGGAVEVTLSGKKEIKSLNLKPEVVDPEDIEMLQDLTQRPPALHRSYVCAYTRCSPPELW